MANYKEQKSLQAIITEAWENETFKNDLINNPKEVIESFMGQSINLPGGKELQVVDQTNENVIYINIPAEPNMEDLELNEEQLEAVAGGSSPYPLINTNLQDLIDVLSGKEGR